MAHLADTGHQPDNYAFKVIYKVPQNKSKQVRKRHFATAEAVAIKIITTYHCANKRRRLTRTPIALALTNPTCEL
ncbi:unnamed protein product [Echinostoma caproni]|uniref:Transposase n=1 Tax=Echinostoma caproni TaxID=27848 RepID=A0A183APA2_9TREM|nr:unnamed protein product [Echinostoma caproni]